MRNILTTLRIIAVVGTLAIMYTMYAQYMDTQKAQAKTIFDFQVKINELENKPLPSATEPKVIYKTNTVTKIINTEPDLSSIVKEWTPRVAVIICRWGEDIARGSATFVNIGNIGIVAVTNKHVLVEDDRYIPNNCGMSNDLLNGYGVDWTQGISTEPNPYFTNYPEDVGYVRIDQADQALKEIVAKPIKLCNNISIGDKLVVLGYPAVGSTKTLTATEGIISGIEQDYYVTSAKIEHGNSGGAAILLKDDCYLGIPSASMAGTLESMGRILKANFVMQYE